MVDQVRVGVIRTSWYADLMHLPNLKSHPGAQLTAICGRNQARAREMADKYAIPAVYTDYRQMLEQADLDAAVIAVPDDHPSCLISSKRHAIWGMTNSTELLPSRRKVSEG